MTCLNCGGELTEVMDNDGELQMVCVYCGESY